MIKSYLSLAVKVLLRRKFFTFISLFGIAFTLMVLTLATAMVDHVFSAAAPQSRLERTLFVTRLEMKGKDNTVRSSPGFGFLDATVRNLPGAERVSLFTSGSEVVSYAGGKKLHFTLKRTDGEFWKILDFDFIEGGPFTGEDDKSGSRVAVINAAMRDRLFGGSSAVGKTIEAGGHAFRVVGVVKDVPIMRFIPFADVWVPTGTEPSTDYRSQFMGDFRAMILATDLSRLPSIKAEFASRVAALQPPDPKTFKTLNTGADTLFEAVSRETIPGQDEAEHGLLLKTLFVVFSVLFMALPALNLVNLNLSRILERASEIGIRKAFGASSRTLVGQFLVENVVLTLFGAAIAWIFSAVILRAVNASGVVPYAEFRMNARILAYGVAVALFFGALSGIYPAWRMSRMHPVQALRRRSS
jgi:putative ABC transport system permease protein